MTIVRNTTPALRAWTVAARPRAAFVRLVVDNAPVRRSRLAAAWRLTGAGQLIRTWVAEAGPGQRQGLAGPFRRLKEGSRS